MILYFIIALLSTIIWKVFFDMYNINCKYSEDKIPEYMSLYLGITLGVLWPLSMIVLIFACMCNTTLKKPYESFIIWLIDKFKNF